MPDQLDCPFIAVYFQNHRPNGVQKQKDERTREEERMFLAFFQIGIFETYQFLYQECRDVAHFKDWIIEVKGMELFLKAARDFNEWHNNNKVYEEGVVSAQLLSEVQVNFWLQNGYLQIPALIGEQECDAVVELMMNTLSIDLNDNKSWYPVHQLLQGLMLQVYQDQNIDKIRYDSKLKLVFTQLYRQKALVAVPEKLGYNPPETDNYRFTGSPLHWDIDFGRGIQYHIQGLIYLNDVPDNRGPLTLIPGFHLEIDEFLAQNPNPELAIKKLRASNRQIAIAGKKGDLIVWLEALPHAASPNHSDQPRFVQYVSFLEL